MADEDSKYYAKKFDAGKSRPDLIPAGALLEVGKVLEYGARKYAANSWKTVPNAEERYVAAMMRHGLQHQQALQHELTTGCLADTTDDESHLEHLAHAACNALFALQLLLDRKQAKK